MVKSWNGASEEELAPFSLIKQIQEPLLILERTYIVRGFGEKRTRRPQLDAMSTEYLKTNTAGIISH